MYKVELEIYKRDVFYSKQKKLKIFLNLFNYKTGNVR